MPCPHGRQKSKCKECGGSGICEHERRKSTCKECGGSGICKHERRKSQCKECGGSSFCKHERQKSRCKECGGSGICEHERQKSQCKECGGSSICEHERLKSQCKECGGSSFCKHERQKSKCKECDATGYLTSLLRNRLYGAMKRYDNRKKEHTLEYLGCTLERFREFVEAKFTPNMTWENQGKWHLDHIKPCASFDLSIEEEIRHCFHYTNFQPLWGEDNISKSDTFCPVDFYSKMEWMDGEGWQMKKSKL